MQNKGSEMPKSIFLCACPRLHPMNALYEWQENGTGILRQSYRTLRADPETLI